MREGGKGSGLCSQLLTPKRSNLPLYCSFPSTFSRSFIQDCQRAGQGILLAELLDLNEPWDRGGARARRRVTEDVGAPAVENGCWTKPSNHAKQAQLALVESSTSGKAACHKVDKRSRRSRVEAHELLQRHLVVVVEGSHLSFTEDKGGEAAEEDRETIELLNFQGCCRIAPVATGKASRENSMHGTGVSTDPGKDSRHGTRASGAHNTNMLSLMTERYWKALK